mmetsp:Transcript_89461/g.186910  ORF Transcript_89461/g.186910 Transcript_89461/m.186910 type:complete len:220 (+) Transcript_89461:668-1327(+)
MSTARLGPEAHAANKSPWGKAQLFAWHSVSDIRTIVANPVSSSTAQAMPLGAKPELSETSTTSTSTSTPPLGLEPEPELWAEQLAAWGGRLPRSLATSFADDSEKVRTSTSLRSVEDCWSGVSSTMLRCATATTPAPSTKFAETVHTSPLKPSSGCVRETNSPAGKPSSVNDIRQRRSPPAALEANSIDSAEPPPCTGHKESTAAPQARIRAEPGWRRL